MHSPTPWTIRPHLPDAHFEVVADAAGNSVGTATRLADAELIVEAVNGVDATRKLQRTLLGWSMERDRLRNIMRGLVAILETITLEDHEIALLDEAREALEEEARDA
jgi:hypothetical protein